jgi:hypothetical protein
MTGSGLDGREPAPERRALIDDSRPQSLPVRQTDLGGYLLRRAKHRRERFFRRAAAFSFSKELARSAYLTGCVLFDGLVLPEPIFLFPSELGWTVSLLALVIAIWAEVRVYKTLFSFRDSTETRP